VIAALRRSMLLAAALSSLAARAPGQETIDYPLVFETADEMEPLGLRLAGYGAAREVAPLARRCYYAGDGAPDVSISEAFLKRYEARGFSLNSLCLALQSPLAFDPETGRRLPSYMIADLDAIRRNEMEEGSVSPTLPLRVPDCFKRGAPLHDCAFAYDVRSGARLSKKALDAIARDRAALDAAMETARRNAAYGRECACKASNAQPEFSTTSKCRLETFPGCDANADEALIAGMLRPEGYMLHRSFSSGVITLIDMSPRLPLGHGYMIYGETTGDGAVARKQASDPRHRATPGRIAQASSQM
jgi:hypothetical protein